MDYVITAAIAAGGIWTGYLIGQFVSIKDTNRRLNSLIGMRDEYKDGMDYWVAHYDSLAEDFDKEVADNITKMGEIDHLSDLVAKFQAKQPERDTNGKFTSRKARVTAELQAYVASKKETVA